MVESCVIDERSNPEGRFNLLYQSRHFTPHWLLIVLGGIQTMLLMVLGVGLQRVSIVASGLFMSLAIVWGGLLFVLLMRSQFVRIELSSETMRVVGYRSTHIIPRSRIKYVARADGVHSWIVALLLMRSYFFQPKFQTLGVHLIGDQMIWFTSNFASTSVAKEQEALLNRWLSDPSLVDVTRPLNT